MSCLRKIPPVGNIEAKLMVRSQSIGSFIEISDKLRISGRKIHVAVQTAASHRARQRGDDGVVPLDLVILIRRMRRSNNVVDRGLYPIIDRQATAGSRRCGMGEKNQRRANKGPKTHRPNALVNPFHRTKSEGDVSHTASLFFAGTYRAYAYPRNRIIKL